MVAPHKRGTDMADSVFDSLECVRRLRDAGIPKKQAEVLAKLLAEAPRGSPMDARLAEQDARFRQDFTALGRQLSIHNWLLAAVASTTVLPALRDLLAR